MAGAQDIRIEAGRLRARFADGAADVAAALALRARAFRAGADDRDRFDASCAHLLVEDVETGAILATARALVFDDGKALANSYAAQFYDLTALEARSDPLLELGRFCLAPEVRDPDVLRLAWGALTALVEARGVGMLFGCTSFTGNDPAPYAETFALLATHQAPVTIGEKAPERVRLADIPAAGDRAAGLAAMPPILRSYLRMGGWVSDHAVIDRDLGTLHVFTGVEVGAVPGARAKALRGIAKPR